ncbi:MAG: GNAT family N-acetyltransferase [Candidatus Saccharibacteria bacterium]
MIENVRLIKANELERLLALYQFLNTDDPLLEVDHSLMVHWSEILRDPNLFYYVVEEDGRLIASCTLAVIKNLTRSARPYGLIENVICHPDYRKRGHARAVLDKAIETAQEKNCYKTMLMTGRKDEGTMIFYEKVGFKRGEKTAFIMRFDRE